MIRTDVLQLFGKLNGWQRIGVVLSVGWVLFITAIVIPDYVDAKNSPQHEQFFFSREMSDQEVFGKVAPSVPPTKADDFLEGNAQGKNPFDRFDKTPRAENGVRPRTTIMAGPFDDLIPSESTAPPVIHFKFDKFLALALIPVVSAWMGAYLIVWAARWIIAGFKRNHE